MVGEDYGIRWLTTYTEGDVDSDAYHPAGRMLSPEEHPFPVGGVSRFDTLYVETGRFLRQLMRDITIAGGRFAIRSFASPAAIASLPEHIVSNCNRLCARALFGANALQPLRGPPTTLLPPP